MAVERRDKFGENLDKLWDIGVSDAIEQIRKSRLLSSADKTEDIAFYMGQGSARNGSIRGSDMIFAEKERRQEERKESEIKKNLGTSRSTISSSFGCNEASLSMECSTSTVDPSDEKMEEDADEEGSESDEAHW